MMRRPPSVAIRQSLTSSTMVLRVARTSTDRVRDITWGAWPTALHRRLLYVCRLVTFGIKTDGPFGHHQSHINCNRSKSICGL